MLEKAHSGRCGGVEITQFPLPFSHVSSSRPVTPSIQGSSPSNHTPSRTVLCLYGKGSSYSQQDPNPHPDSCRSLLSFRDHRNALLHEASIAGYWGTRGRCLEPGAPRYHTVLLPLDLLQRQHLKLHSGHVNLLLLLTCLPLTRPTESAFISNSTLFTVMLTLLEILQKRAVPVHPFTCCFFFNLLFYS